MAKKDYTGYGAIYRIENSVNGKVYIGQTTGSVASRFKAHLISTGRNASPLLSAAIKKYGAEAFSVKVLYVAENQPHLDAQNKRSKYLGVHVEGPRPLLGVCGFTPDRMCVGRGF